MPPHLALGRESLKVALDEYGAVTRSLPGQRVGDLHSTMRLCYIIDERDRCRRIRQREAGHVVVCIDIQAAKPGDDGGVSLVGGDAVVLEQGSNQLGELAFTRRSRIPAADADLVIVDADVLLRQQHSLRNGILLIPDQHVQVRLCPDPSSSISQCTRSFLVFTSSARRADATSSSSTI